MSEIDNRAFTDSKPVYDKLTKELKLTAGELFNIAIAIGIISEKRTKLKNKHELLNTYTTDKDRILQTYIKLTESDINGLNILRIMEEYAETGIKIIEKDFLETGNFHYSRYIK